MDDTERFGLAAERGEVAEVIRLLDQGVPVDVLTPTERSRPRTALDRAIWAQQTLVVSALIEGGADLHQVVGEYAEATPVWAATHLGNRSILQILLRAGADPDSRRHVAALPPLYLARAQHRDDLEHLLLAHGAREEEIEVASRAHLISIAAAGFPDQVRLLLDRGAVFPPGTVEAVERERDRHRADPAAYEDFQK
ncbi:ankyrin repeat domain-containing protein [Cryptosporangium phraense]|uniref:Uncharacterized protein n=1 Tax=Cryptosporangium phraense TaxID=2593070 RepID=A0A545ARM5_9ACTN|nr:hypothetical protein [Cryptosporangium phraense]TQS43986.1 hypothetical protein FL583_16130 [Cryptosporangium phraense]